MTSFGSVDNQLFSRRKIRCGKEGVMRSAIKTLLVAILGCIIIATVAPFIKMAAVNHVINGATREMKNGNSQDALKGLRRFEPWGLRYPSVAGRLSCEIVRACCIQGNADEANRHAEWMYGVQSEEVPLRSPRGPADLWSFLQDGPDRLANMLLEWAHGVPYGWKKLAGYDVILFELEKSERYEELETTAKAVLEKDPNHVNARNVVNLAESNRQKGVPPGSRAISKGGPESTKAVSTTPSPPPADDAREERIRQLRKREAALVASIEAHRKTSAQTQATPAYQAALQRHDQLMKQSQELEQRFNGATGQTRINTMNELRQLKGEISQSDAELKRLAPAGQQTEKRGRSNPANLSGLSALEKELEEVRSRISTL
jgi:hypothetical protein